MAKSGGIGRGLAALAAGFGQGYVSAKEKQRERDMEERRLKLEERRQALENQKLEDDKAMRDKLSTLEQDVKPAQVYAVQTQDGPVIYADEKSAREAATHNNSQMVPVFSVAGKTYQDKEAADAAAEALNSPAVKMRKRAEVYQSYGREDLAAAAMSNYKLTLDNNRREMQQQFLVARQTGDMNAVVDAYNKQLPNGLQAQLAQGDNGQPVIQLMRGGQPVGKAMPFDWDAIEKQVMTTPDNMLEIYKTTKDLELRGKQVANDTARTGATVAESGARVGLINAQAADVPAQAADRRTQAQASSTSAGAAATNARTNALQVSKPAVSAVPDAKGGLNFVTVPQTPNANGTWTLGSPQVAPAGGGLQYPAGYVAGQRNSLGGLGLDGVGQPQVDPAAVEGVLQRLQEEANKRAAARNKGPAVVGEVGY